MGLWTLTHLYQLIPTVAVFIILAIVGKKTLGKCPRRLQYIPFQVISVALLVLEVIKQIKSFDGGSYNLYSLPLHYCSLFLYVLPFHAFYRGKHSRFVNAVAFGCLASLTLDMILMPEIIYSSWDIKNFFSDFFCFHTVTFHNLVILYFILTVAFRAYELRTKHDLKVMGIFLAVYVAIAATFSYTLKVNYHSLYRCNIGFLEGVRANMVEKLGALGSVIYVSIMFVLTILFAYAAYFLAKLLIRGIDRISARKSEAIGEEYALTTDEAAE